MEHAINDLRYLKLLRRDFPNISKVTTEIINLEAILHLPKPTEHFLADLHGENDAFQHVLRNASGNIRRKVTELFGNTLREQDMRDLCALIYYPEQKLEYIKQQDKNIDDYYQTTLNQLVAICRRVSSKYTRSKVRKNLPQEFSYIIEELLHESTDDHNKEAYVNVIIKTIIATRQADHFIKALCYLIQRLSIDQLHVLGDIYDRGPGAHLIMNTLETYHQWDIQWGNHDILWMGAVAGNPCCMASVIRLSLRYGNTQTLEDGYAINLVPLATFAMEQYKNDPCTPFAPILEDSQNNISEKTRRFISQMHKAISIIQFKLEGQLYKKHPEWKMEDRCILEHIDKEKGTIILNGKEYPLKDHLFPTLMTDNPYQLSPEEEDVVNSLCHTFQVSDKLNNHIACLLSHGSMYGIYNDNLLFHASVPLDKDGHLKETDVCGKKVKGRQLMDCTEQVVRLAYDQSASPSEREKGKDYYWYLWCGPDSPLFDKSKMATFERYFIKDKSTHQEEKGWYYQLRDNAEICDRIMDEFGLAGPHRHIINGHVPVRVSGGESPIKAGGKLMVIDGGFAKAYHDTTGIAGYTLVYHSRGFQLVQHTPFTSKEEAIKNGTDIKSITQIVEMTGQREMVNDTDKGAELRTQIKDLQDLLLAYQKGILKEK